jgi:hypothetical protein
LGALIDADVRRASRRTSKPLGFAPPGQGYQPIARGPRGAPPPGGPLAMGRLTPDRPSQDGAFKCAYCGRFGQPGACAGCGAPNAPSGEAVPLPARRPDTILRYHEAGVLTFNEVRILNGMNPVPDFDMVRR